MQPLSAWIAFVAKQQCVYGHRDVIRCADIHVGADDVLTHSPHFAEEERRCKMLPCEHFMKPERVL